MSPQASESFAGPAAAKPPAATTGSPGTAVFIPPAQPTRSYVTSSSSSSSHDDTTRSQAHSLSPSFDPAIPPEWLFESSYGLFGGVAGAMVPARPKMNKDSSQHHQKTQLGVFGASLFGRKKEKGKGKEKEVVPVQAVEASLEKNNDPTPPHASPVHPRIVTDLSPGPSDSKNDHLSPPANGSGVSSSLPHSPMRRLGESGHEDQLPSPSRTYRESDTPHGRRGPRFTTLTTNLAPIPASTAPSRAASPTAEFHEAITPVEHRASSIHSQRVPSKLKQRNFATPKRRGPRRPMTADGVAGSRFNAQLRYGAEATFSISGAQIPGPNIAIAGSHIATNASLFASSVPLTSSSSASSRVETPIEAFRRRMREAREQGFTMKNKKRHHPKSRQEAPYPRNYENNTLDHDRWENAFTTRLARSITFHPFPTPPVNVLDLGCGSGDWILTCAGEWKNTRFVGMDLVPIQPNLERIGNKDLALRVKWVLGNFLDSLPFADGEFDFVHIKRIARGVPEDRWHSLFEEVARVLKPGGAFEMVEEDLFFPGSETITGENSDEEATDPVPEMAGTTGSLSTQTVSSMDIRTPFEDDVDPVRAQTPDRHLLLKRLQEKIEAGPRQNSQLDIADVRIDNETSVMEEYPSLGDESRPRMSLDAWQARGPMRADPHPYEESSAKHNPGDDDDHTELFHGSTGPLANPRDHRLLELAYNELHHSRFINLTPLSILHSALTLHFRDIQTHEPVELAFPAESKQRAFGGGRSRSNSNSSSRSVDASVPLLELLPVGQAMARDPQSTRKKPIELDAPILQMHLAARVNEILACAEEMWDFIEECRSSPLRWKNDNLDALAKITREEWDECLSNFEMDMEDRTGLGSLMEQQFAWSVQKPQRTNTRKVFDDAVERWEAYQRLSEDQMGKKGRRALSQSQLLSRKIRVFIARK